MTIQEPAIADTPVWLVLTLKDGRTIRTKVIDHTLYENRFTGDLAGLSWVTAPDSPTRLLHIDTDEVLAIHTGPGLHTLESAWGREWCECRHTMGVEQTPFPGGDTDLPDWWEQALRDALNNAIYNYGSKFRMDEALDRLRRLAAGLGADGTWDRWDEFSPRVLGLPVDLGEAYLRMLMLSGVIDFVVHHWDYTDGSGYRHYGADCGCGTVTLRLNREKP